jgi:hypothetical protein
LSTDQRTIHPSLAEAEHWAREHQGLLKRCFDRFQRSGEWPTLEQLQHDFAVQGDEEVDVATLAYKIPGPLGRVENQRLVLLMRGLRHVPAATELLEIWCSALRLACDRWLEDPEIARLTRHDVLGCANGVVRKTDLVSSLLLQERVGLGGGTGFAGEDKWSRDVIASIRVARDVRSANELIARRDESEFPLPPESGEGLPREERRTPLRRLGSALRHPIVAGLMVIAIAGIAGLAWRALNGGGDGSSGPAEPSTPAAGPAPVPPSLQEKDQTIPDAQGLVREQVWAPNHARTFGSPFGPIDEGPGIPHNAYVMVKCKVYEPELESVRPDGYWYLIFTEPWMGLYSPANSFWNGDIPGHKLEHPTDWAVPNCPAGGE